jgi:hypothetical protein
VLDLSRHALSCNVELGTREFNVELGITDMFIMCICYSKSICYIYQVYLDCCAYSVE